MATVSMSCKVPPEIAERFAERAKERGLSTSRALRELVEMAALWSRFEVCPSDSAGIHGLLFQWEFAAEDWDSPEAQWQPVTDSSVLSL